MVYTIISKLPFITSDKSNRRFFKIFVFGSLIYILLHYYLYQKDQEGIMDSVKTYIYYAMALDFCLAYALDQWMGNKEEEEKQEDTLPNNQKQQKPPQNQQQVQQQTQQNQQQMQQVNKYTPEQRAEYERKFVEWKKQQDFMKEKEQQTKQKNEVVEDDEFEKEEEEEPSLPKVTKKTKNAERSERSGNSKKSSKSLQEDTDIPRFVRK